MAGKGQMAMEYRALRDRLYWARKRNDVSTADKIQREIEHWKDRKFRRQPSGGTA